MSYTKIAAMSGRRKIALCVFLIILAMCVIRYHNWGNVGGEVVLLGAAWTYLYATRPQPDAEEERMAVTGADRWYLAVLELGSNPTSHSFILERDETEIELLTETERKFWEQNGEKQIDFIDVVTWRQTAEFVSRYFRKGSMIAVQGSLQSRKWQDKDGNNRISWEVQASRVWFGGGKNDSQTAESRTEAESAPAALPPAASGSYSGSGAEEFSPMSDEDLPF